MRSISIGSAWPASMSTTDAVSGDSSRASISAVGEGVQLRFGGQMPAQDQEAHLFVVECSARSRMS